MTKKWHAIWSKPEHDYEPIRAAEATAAERKATKAAARADTRPAGQQCKDPPSSLVQGADPIEEPGSSDAQTADAHSSVKFVHLVCRVMCSR
ncbi:TPA: hypothetical protein ACH3X1_015968 [Trebouxia sp. C0004]